MNETNIPSQIERLEHDFAELLAQQPDDTDCAKPQENQYEHALAARRQYNEGRQ